MNNTEAIVTFQNVSKNFGAQDVLVDAGFAIHDGERVGLIGRNGAGKSTLLTLMAGLDAPEGGLVTRKRGLRTAMMGQDCALALDQTVGAVLAKASGAMASMRESYQAKSEELSQLPQDHPRRQPLMEEVTNLERRLAVHGAWNWEQQLSRVRTALNLPPDEARLDTLSGGELRRVELSEVLLEEPDLLLLDEPTNHLDIASVEWLEGFLNSFGGACVLITHDRYFLDRVVSRILELEDGLVYSHPGSYNAFLERQTQRRQHEARAEDRRQTLLRRELAWMRQGPKARSTRQQARLDRFHELQAQQGPSRDDPPRFAIPTPPRLGKRILDAEEISKRYGETVLFEDLSFSVEKQMRLGVVGPNGCGKTSLLRVLMGHEPPDTGSIYIGENTEFLYVDQLHEEIDPTDTILDHVSGGSIHVDVDGRRVHVPGYLESFLFDSGAIRMPMRNLSGGERNRIELAKKLLKRGNFLILDEPTNDLDLPTLRLLEETVAGFEGVAILVSHDRYFLNRLCTHMLVFEAPGETVFINGNYDDYKLYAERRDAAKQPAAPEQPAKSKPKPARNQERRLSYKEKRELAAIEQTIEETESEVTRLENAIHEPGFYEQPYENVQETLNALEAAKQRLDGLYERWEELESIPEK